MGGFPPSRLSDVPQASPPRANSLIFSGSVKVSFRGSAVLQVRLEKLHLPTAPLEEVHVDLVRGSIVAAHASW
jgi:hypothetical protein